MFKPADDTLSQCSHGDRSLICGGSGIAFYCTSLVHLSMLNSAAWLQESVGVQGTQGGLLELD
jgi:hypothetical protein